MRYSSKYIRKYGLSYIAAFLMVAMEAVADLLQPTLLSRMIDDGVAKLDQSIVLHYGGLMLLVTAAGALAASGRNIVASQVSQRFGSELRSDLYGHIQSLSLGSIDKFDRAGLVTRLTNDVTQLQNFVNGMMRIFAKAPILCIGSLMMAIRLNPSLSTVLIVVVPIVAVLIFFNLKIGFPLFLRVQRAMDRLNGIMREYLSGVRVVKAFNRFTSESEKFAGVNDEYRLSSMRAMRRMAVFNPAILLTVNFGIVAVLWIGALRVDGGQMQVGHIVAFVNYMTQILFSLMMISMVFNMLVRAKASYSRIGEVMAAESTMTWTEGVSLPAGSEGRIDFDRVSFSYHGEDGAPVLKDISLTILPGQTVGIIGSTGSGKSSLVGLVMRFYDATGGAVRLDGADVRKLDPSLIRDKAAIVPQKAMLFSGTIMDNIRWGKEDATEEEVAAAARMAAAHDFISALPEGYQTKLGQGGVNLSGGQKQRVSIARALVRQPRILILDDCTSAVDAATEASIKQALREYAQGLTCLLIAQRITSVMDADHILVLDGGAVAGFGTHEELMQDCVVYQEIYRSQIGKEVGADGATA
ncbi:ABC transporter ATP-binding protein [Cohnella lubricantis]|uniref:ABC transporter ATP-binding protein n=1 Tax=Cohnella lubricantis TaxID=2163172 RepID=A0A841T998_9BACL|nr:ABC transporter ATP-binding protein [Cohnella lubricantis]MBB6676616.1 ABC transporter ATP-binding protein [Cohnella lubricantis]